MVPVPSIVQPAGGTGTGPASAGLLSASDSAPAATVPRNASRKHRPDRPAGPPLGKAQTFVIEFPLTSRDCNSELSNGIARFYPDRLRQKCISHNIRPKV